MSPIDLIPDFIPVLGYLDEVILLPVLIWCTIKLLPDAVLQHCRQQAELEMQASSAKPRSWIGAVVIVTIWLALSYLLVQCFWPRGTP